MVKKNVSLNKLINLEVHNLILFVLRKVMNVVTAI